MTEGRLLGPKARGGHAELRHGKCIVIRLAVGGRRISREIDPRTARPATHALASATVLAPTGRLADAWATACMILGPDAALAAIEAQPGLEAYLIVRAPEGFRVLATRGFPPPVE